MCLCRKFTQCFIRQILLSAFDNSSNYFVLSFCKTAFLLSGNRQNRLEGRNKGDVHMLSNCDTICSRVCVAFSCTIGYIIMPKELVTWDHAWVTDIRLCPPLLSSSCCSEPKLLKKPHCNCCPKLVWLLEAPREKLGLLLGLGLYFLPCHCSWRRLSSLTTAET